MRGVGTCGIWGRRHALCDTRLAEACPLEAKLQNTVNLLNYRVEEMRLKWPFWKQRAPKMRLALRSYGAGTERKNP